jgi:hypothetical protein
MLTAVKGPILYWTANTEMATVKMDKESADMILAAKEGAISITSATVHQN